MEHTFSSRNLISLAIPYLCLLGAPACASIVSGKIYDDPSHQPLAEAHVVFASDKGSRQDSLVTDSSGSFRFEIPSGCGNGCYVQVRKEGYWMAETYTFMLAATENRGVDLGMELIHDLVIRVISARDSSRPLDSAQATLVMETTEGVDYRTADPSGQLRFPNLYALPIYRLTVAAPGYMTSTDAFRFDFPKVSDTVVIALVPDTTQSSKTVQGTLTSIGGHPYQGRITLRCSSALVQAVLFANSGPDGRFSIRGVPSVCDTGMLYGAYFRDSLALSLQAPATSVTWEIDESPGLGLRSGRAGIATPLRPAGAFDLLGRRIQGVRLRRLP